MAGFFSHFYNIMRPIKFTRHKFPATLSNRYEIQSCSCRHSNLRLGRCLGAHNTDLTAHMYVCMSRRCNYSDSSPLGHDIMYCAQITGPGSVDKIHTYMQCWGQKSSQGPLTDEKRKVGGYGGGGGGRNRNLQKIKSYS